MAKNEILLNHIFLKNRIVELGIKQWWLAEQVGVDRKTVIRWIHGQVRSIQIENVKKLSLILKCETSQLTVSNEADQFATHEDQKVAASMLVDSSLFEKLGPIGEWNVIESLLKATVVSNLPISVLGELYDQLTIASWRQSKIDQAANYNLKTEEIARKTNDQCLLASALISKANIHSWRGQTQNAIKTLNDCLLLQKFLEPLRVGSVYSNLGGILHESGDLAEGKKNLQKSLEIFAGHGTAMNLSISHCHLGMIALKLNELNEAESETLASIQFAKKADYHRGKQMGHLLLAEISASKGEKDKALSLVNEALCEFEKLGICEGLNFEFAGRVHRLLGDFEQAEKYLRQGISVSQEFPVYLAALCFELSLLLKQKGSVSWQNQAKEALSLYNKVECPLMVEQVKNHFGLK